MPKFTELPGASPPGPPDPQLFFWSLWPHHYQNASDGPVAYLIRRRSWPHMRSTSFNKLQTKNSFFNLLNTNPFNFDLLEVSH